MSEDLKALSSLMRPVAQVAVPQAQSTSTASGPAAQTYQSGPQAGAVDRIVGSRSPQALSTQEMLKLVDLGQKYLLGLGAGVGAIKGLVYGSVAGVLAGIFVSAGVGVAVCAGLIALYSAIGFGAAKSIVARVRAALEAGEVPKDFAKFTKSKDAEQVRQLIADLEAIDNKRKKG